MFESIGFGGGQRQLSHWNEFIFYFSVFVIKRKKKSFTKNNKVIPICNIFHIVSIKIHEYLLIYGRKQKENLTSDGRVVGEVVGWEVGSVVGKVEGWVIGLSEGGVVGEVVGWVVGQVDGCGVRLQCP